MKFLLSTFCIVIVGMVFFIKVMVGGDMKEKTNSIYKMVDKYYSGQGELQVTVAAGKFVSYREISEINEIFGARLLIFINGYNNTMPLYIMQTTKDSFLVVGEPVGIPSGVEMTLKSYHNPEAKNIEGKSSPDYKRICYTGLENERCMTLDDTPVEKISSYLRQ